MIPDSSNETSRRKALWAGGLALVGLLVLMTLPSSQWFRLDDATMLVVHLLLEMFSVVVSVLVVVIAWHAFSVDDRRIANTLIFGFTVVAGCDVVHALSYPGMPTFITPGSTSKGIFFWFAGRGFELLTVGLVASRLHFRGTRWAWQLAALATLVALFALGTWHLDWFPQTHIAGHGVTPFKTAVEVFLSAGNLVAAIVFWRHASRSAQDARQAYFAAACWVMALGELTFTSYYDTTDFLVIFGHLFKVGAYALIYAATFELGLREPFRRLQQSEHALRNKQAELDAVLQQVPAGLARLDKEGRFLYVNAHQERLFGKPLHDISGRPFEDIIPKHRLAELSHRWAMAMSGQRSTYEWNTLDEHGLEHHHAITLAPERAVDGRVIGAISVIVNTTEQRLLQNQLIGSLREVSDLKTALDAHAIVAITDARGVITSVNDKFCLISQYDREELVGQNHRIINSGYHPPAFFHELWRTISSGTIWNGEICNRARDGSLYWVYTTIVPFVNAQGQAERYVAIRADITERKRIELQVHQLAYHDSLTDLPNRRLLMSRMDQHMDNSTSNGHLGALLFLDLDHFKDINDTQGHQQGDALLRLTAERLRSTVRRSDTVARFGGDEFVVLLSDLGVDATEATTQAGRMAEEILHTLGAPYALEGVEVNCPASMGVVMFQGRRTAANELIKQADIALYQAKGTGRNTVCFFDPAIQKAFEYRMAIEADLRHALVRDEFRIYYQPITDTHRRVVGVEALLRWQHPQRGLVSPIDFIPLAEKSGLIVGIGQWVIEQTCSQLAQWQDHPVRCDWQISVNVSSNQFRQADFVAQVLAPLSRFAVQYGRLKLEVTESSLQSNLCDTVQKMQQLRAHGVRFAIDDFGTGYSSLSYIKELPINVLKIDRSFVRHVDSSREDASIAKTILTLAQNLGLDVVAEGVETEAQLETLRSFGCTYFQGYLFSRPVPVDQLPAR